MTQQKTDRYINVCMKTWLLCEAKVHAKLRLNKPRLNLVIECSACAKACFVVAAMLETNTEGFSNLVLNCLLHCRQCSMECEKYSYEEDVQFCGIVSHICGDTMKEIVAFPLN